MVEVEIWKTNTLKVHDTLEYEFEALLKEFVYDEEAGGEESKVRTLIWAQGVAMWITYVGRPTDAVVNDEVNGILHFQRVTYAIKETFEKRLVRGNVTIYLLDQNEIPLYRDLAEELKWLSQWKKGIKHVPESYRGDAGDPADPVFVKNLKVIKKKVGIKNDEEYEFIKAGYDFKLPATLTADILKQRRIDGPAAERHTKTRKAKKSSIRSSGSGTDEKLRS